MIVRKTKNYINQFSLTEFKTDLDIDPGDTSYDGRITRLTQAVCDQAEQFLGEDIVPTSTIIEEENYLVNLTYFEFRLPATSSIAITGITASNGYPSNQTNVVLDPTTYAIERYSNYTNIRFKNSISCNKLVIGYTSGMNPIPQSIKSAITLQVRYLLDVDNSGIITQGTRTNTFELLLSPYKNLFYR